MTRPDAELGCTPDRMHPRGEAVAGTTRVWGGIPGEPCHVRVEGQGAHQRYARWVGSPEPSPHRVAPPCPVYDTCGGCAWMHLSPAGAAHWRRQRVVDELAGANVEPVVHLPGAARHVVKLVAVEGADGLRFGAYGRHSHSIVDVAGCLALTPGLRPFTSLPPLPAPRGLVRHLVVRQSSATGRTLATLVVGRLDGPAVRRLAEALPADAVAVHVNTQVGDAILARDGETHTVRGKPWIEERLGDTRLRIGPTDFFQTNPAVAARMWADLPALPGPLVDLYAGIGAATLALAMRDRPPAVVGVEVSPAAVRRAIENAALNDVDATFTAGRAADVPLPDLRGGTVILDPPRKGLEPGVLPRVLALDPARIVYVACDPAALGRDLTALRAVGWHPERVTPYDMFPMTPHVETVALLARR